MTLNFQSYLEKMLKRFYLASLPVKPLEWSKYQQNIWGTVLMYWLFLWETPNLSLKLSTSPEECKVAKLKPIFKKGARTDPRNYRPISPLPLVSKIIEKSIHFQIEDYFNKKKLIYMYQSGFKTNHSIDFCLTQLRDLIATGMNKQMQTGTILVDLQKAFDTLDHGFSLEKIKYFGFRASVIKWFESYISNRKFWFVLIMFFLRLEH